MESTDFISEKIDKLRKSEVKVAEFVRANASAVIHLSISEVADRCAVSEPTVIRFCRALGFRGFQDLKIYLAQTTVPVVRNIHEAIDGTEAPPELIRKVFDGNAAAIRNSLATLDYNAAMTAVNLIHASGRVIFYGMGGSAVVAMDAYHKFFRLGVTCQWFNDTHMAIMSAALLQKNDVFVAISHSGATMDVVKTLRAAEEAGAVTVAIVTHSKSPVSNAAQYSLCVASDETRFKFEPMSSRIAQLSVVDILAVGVGLKRQEEAVANLAKTRRAVAKDRY